MKTDVEYRNDLIANGVRADLIATCIGHDLDRIGNIVGVYRTSMEEQDPARFAIEQYAARK